MAEESNKSKIKNLDKKFWAMFHDPVFKVFLLAEKEKHENISKKYFEILKENGITPESIKEADWLGASIDRLFIPKIEGYLNVNWVENPIIIHPISGEKFSRFEFENISVFKTLDRNDLELGVLGNVIKDEQLSDDEKYMLLWEIYSNILKEVEKFGKSRKIITNLPADTRFPDHTIWEHLSNTESLASALPNPAFLIVSISPVQAFISIARKVRDFWNGSYMLSYLSWKAIEVVVESYGPDSIIFPDLHGQPLWKQYLHSHVAKGVSTNELLSLYEKSLENIDLNIPSIPNRFLALINYEDAEEIINNIKNKISHSINEIYKDILEVINKKGIKVDSTFQDMMQHQLKNYFNVSIVAVPWSLDKDNLASLKYNNVRKKVTDILGDEYKKEIFAVFDKLNKGDKDSRLTKYELDAGTLYQVLYEISEKMAAATKSQRIIEENKPEHGYKCSLCGEREALHLERSIGYDEIKNDWKIFEDRRIVKEGEHLCGICLTKRLFHEYLRNIYKSNDLDKFFFATRFNSTADVAQLIWKENNKEIIDKLEKKLQNYFRYGDVEIETEYFYPGRIDSEIKRIKGSNMDKEEKESKIAELKEYKKEIEKLDLKETPKYYAIVKFDGDKMGELLKGTLLTDIWKTYHPDAYNDLKTKHKGEFNKIKDIIKEDFRRPLSMALHRLISRSLRNFALEFVKTAVEDVGKGQLIFAGGDDVFAMLPLENLWESINLIRAFYTGEVVKINGKWKPAYGKDGSGWIEKDNDFFITLSKKATGSMGVAIVHWEEPLSVAIHLAEEAEKEAKNRGRNALSVTLKKRSGEIRKFTVNWYYKLKDPIKNKGHLCKDIEDNNQKCEDEMKKICNEDFQRAIDFINDVILEFDESFKKGQNNKKGGLSPNFINALKNEFWSMIDKNDKEIKDMFIVELNRLLLRSLMGNKEERKEEKEKLLTYIEPILLAEEIDKECCNLWKIILPNRNLKEVIHMFEIIDFVAKGGKDE